jgi:hypothetical protein
MRGGWGGGMFTYNPSSYGYGIVVGGMGEMPVFDGQLLSPDQILPAAGLQVGPVNDGPGVGAKDQNVLYEGIGQENLQPSSLYSAQLSQRVQSLPETFNTCGNSFTSALFAPSEYNGSGVLVYDADHLGWIPNFGSGCPAYHGGTSGAGCHSFSPDRNHTAGGEESMRLTTTGTDWNILVSWRGCTHNRSDFSSLEMWVYASSSALEFRVGLHFDPYPESVDDENSVYHIVNGLTPNTWNKVTINMDGFGPGEFNKVEIRSTATAATQFYVDDIVLQ